MTSKLKQKIKYKINLMAIKINIYGIKKPLRELFKCRKDKEKE